MNIKKIVHLLLGTLLAATLSAQATTITFDDLTEIGAEIPTGYAGLNWTNMFVLNGAEYDEVSGYTPGTISDPNVAYNAYGDPAAFSSATPFTLSSMYVTAAWEDGLLMTLTGLNGSTVLYSDVFTLSTTTPLFLELDWSGITEVTLSTDLNSHVAIDNIGINESSVPEPATSFLLFCGLTGIALVGRRRVRA